MGVKLGLLGLGSFGTQFSALFAAHPLVDGLYLCDAEKERVESQAAIPVIAKKLLGKTDSFEELLKTDCDGIVVITQPWLHAPQCIKAMEAGKYVYSAVPVFCVPDDEEILDYCGKIIETVQRTGMEYMCAETTIYRPQTMFCRKMAREGMFGDFVYGEAEYTHDLDNFGCSLREVNQARRTGKVGEQAAAIMEKYWARGLHSHPMAYPTHSTSGVINVMRTLPVKVSAIGHKDPYNDPYFAHSDFDGITAFFHLANGCALRVSELRQISSNIGLSGEDFRIFGTRGSYSNEHWCDNGRVDCTPCKKKNVVTDLTEAKMRDKLPPEVEASFRKVFDPDATPDSDFTYGGHGGSHPYLVNEFVYSVFEHRRPYIDAWDAAVFTSMGVAAHKSAQKDGELVKVETFGKVWK